MTGNRLALLVAADQFADPRLSALQAPQADINALAELLSDTEIGGFTVERLVNGTSQELRLALNRLFSRRDPEDFCMLHVSSHGLKDASGELYLAARDTQREYLEATSVDASYLRRLMDHSRAGAVVVLLDCCYGGAFERGMVPRGDGDVDLSGTLVPVTEGRGRAVITASTAIEYAFEGTELRPGAKPEPSIFTEAVVAGIRQGPADVDSNNVLTLSELFTFVSRRVRQRSAHQTPQWWLYGMSGELVIARNPNPIVTPKDLPDDLVEVLRLRQPAARLGAVYALRALVTEGDPGSALSAYRTLETLAVDDSRQVSTGAAEVLAGIHTTVMVRHGSGGSAALPASAGEETIDFGSVAVDQAVPPARIELGGALAPACKLEVRNAPVELTRRGLRAEVRLDTSRAATVDGQIEVVGPGGGAVVRVLARIGADVGAETRAAVIRLEPALPTAAEVVAGTGPATETSRRLTPRSRRHSPALRSQVGAPETDADVAFDTGSATEAEVAVAALAARRRSLPPLYRWRRVLIAILLLGLGVGGLYALDRHPMRWVIERWYDLRGTTVVVEGVQPKVDPATLQGPDPAALTDGLKASWAMNWKPKQEGASCGGAPGTGVIVLTIPAATRVREIDIAAGLPEDDPARLLQFRPKSIGISFDGGFCRNFALTDVPGQQMIKVDSGVAVQTIRIGVDTTFPVPADGQAVLSITEVVVKSRPPAPR
jgi:hypothetical protein